MNGSCWQSGAPGNANFHILHCNRCSNGSQLFQHQSSCEPYEASYLLQLEVVECYLGIFGLGNDHQAWLWSENGHGQCRIRGGEKGGGWYFLHYFLKLGHSKKSTCHPSWQVATWDLNTLRFVDRPIVLSFGKLLKLLPRLTTMWYAIVNNIQSCVAMVAMTNHEWWTMKMPQRQLWQEEKDDECFTNVTRNGGSPYWKHGSGNNTKEVQKTTTKQSMMINLTKEPIAASLLQIFWYGTVEY